MIKKKRTGKCVICNADVHVRYSRTCGKKCRTALIAVHGHCTKNKSSKEYRTWLGMKTRCFNTLSDKYRLYGARGITVCNRWYNSFQAFLEDMGPAPTPKHSIDRIDGNGNYEPKNCRWATALEQAANTRVAKHLTLNGETKCLAGLCTNSTV